MDDLGQYYVIHLNSNRKLLRHNKWTTATEMCNRRKGKIKTNLPCAGLRHYGFSNDAYHQLRNHFQKRCGQSGKDLL